MTKSSHLGPCDLLVASVMNLCWGLNIIAVKLTVGTIAPLTAGWLRQIVVLLICLPFLKIVPGRMRVLLAVAVLNGALFIIIVNLSLKVSSNLAALAIAGQLGVPFALLLAVIFLGERIALFRVVGIAFTFAGVVLLVFDPGVMHEIAGVLLTAMGSVIWAIGSLLFRQLRGVPVLTIYAWIGLGGALLIAPAALLVEPEAMRALHNLRLADFGLILFTAIGSTILGHGGLAWLLQRHPVETVVPLTLAAPVISVIASSLFFGTVLTAPMIAGGMIAMIGVAIITIRSAQAKPR